MLIALLGGLAPATLWADESDAVDPEPMLGSEIEAAAEPLPPPMEDAAPPAVPGAPFALWELRVGVPSRALSYDPTAGEALASLELGLLRRFESGFAAGVLAGLDLWIARRTFAGIPLQLVGKYSFAQNDEASMGAFVELRAGASIGSARFDSDWLLMGGASLGLELFPAEGWSVALGAEVGGVSDLERFALPIGLVLRLAAFL